MSEIIPNLYLGGDIDARTIQDANLVINCTTDIPFYTNSNTIRIPIKDNGDFLQQKKLIECIEDDQVFSYMNEFLNLNKKILVHCRYGQQRSCAFVVCFLIWKYNMDIFDAIAFVKTRRQESFFGSVNFMDAIKHYSKIH